MIGSEPNQNSLEQELLKFQEKLSVSLGSVLSSEMDKWLTTTTQLIEKDPKIKNVLFTNLQLYNSSTKYDKLVEDWAGLFRTSLIDLLRVKGVVKTIDTVADLNQLKKIIEAGGDESREERDYDLTFVSLVRGNFESQGKSSDES